MKVVSAVSKWNLIHNHPGGYDEEREVQMVSKHSWKTMQEKGGEIEGKVGSMIKGVELALSAKTSMKLTRVDEFETQTTEKIKREIYTRPLLPLARDCCRKNK